MRTQTFTQTQLNAYGHNGETVAVIDEMGHIFGLGNSCEQAWEDMLTQDVELDHDLLEVVTIEIID